MSRCCDIMIKNFRQLCAHDNRSTKGLLSLVSHSDTISDAKLIHDLESLVSRPKK